MQFYPLKQKNARISSEFGNRINPITKKFEFHSGIDIAIPTGTEVFSPLSGLVSKIGENSTSGKYLEIISGDYKFLFCHLSKILVKIGDTVNKTSPVALSGSSGRVTGSHLHFGVYYKNKAINPLGFNPIQNTSNLLFIAIPLIILYTIFKQK